MVRSYESIAELLGTVPCVPLNFMELAWHEAKHITFAHILGLYVHGASIRDWRKCGGRTVVDFEPTVFRGRRGDPRSMRERIDAIDLFLAGPLGAAVYRCLESGQSVSFDRLLWHFGDTARGQGDLDLAVDVASRMTATEDEAIRLVDERVCETAARIAEGEPLVQCASVVAGLLLEFRELDGCHLHWALRRALDGRSLEELIPRLQRRLEDPRIGTHIITGLPDRHAWLAR
jgi:hypothetical protein